MKAIFASVCISRMRAGEGSLLLLMLLWRVFK